MVLPFVVDHAGGIDAVLQDVLGCSGQQAECESKRPVLLVQQGVLQLFLGVTDIS